MEGVNESRKENNDEYDDGLLGTGDSQMEVLGSI